MLFGTSVVFSAVGIIVPCRMKSPSKKTLPATVHCCHNLAFLQRLFGFDLGERGWMSPFHRLLFDSGVIWHTHVSSPGTIQLYMSLLSSS
ncbi:hypothetical protein TNCV_5007621 [Trichonephila clavipes]|nr:hypothetical protein TNCV_5007621 [Trichonephila clavipes]